MTVLTKPPGRVSFELGPAQTAQYQQPPKMGWWDSMFGPSPMAVSGAIRVGYTVAVDCVARIEWMP